MLCHQYCCLPITVELLLSIGIDDCKQLTCVPDDVMCTWSKAMQSYENMDKINSLEV